MEIFQEQTSSHYETLKSACVVKPYAEYMLVWHSQIRKLIAGKLFLFHDASRYFNVVHIKRLE